MLVHHSDCGMLTFSDDDLATSIADEVGHRPGFRFAAFPDLDRDVRESIARIRANPFIPRTEHVRGFVYDVGTGTLREVAPA